MQLSCGWGPWSTVLIYMKYNEREKRKNFIKLFHPGLLAFVRVHVLVTQSWLTL